MSETLKIGEREYKLPFRYEPRFGAIADADGLWLCESVFGGKGVEQDNIECQYIADALNQKSQLEKRVSELEEVLRLASQYKLTTRLQKAVNEVLNK